MGFFNKLKQGTTDTIKGYDKVKTNRKLSYEELLEIMQCGTYSIGVPKIQGSGIMKCIKFPPVDKYLVQVAVTGTTISIVKINNGVSSLIKEAAKDTISNGYYSILNEENINLNRATREVGETIRGILKEKRLLKE
jgi:hypothetical protein